MKIKYRPEIDGLRAIAIISVVIYHAGFVYLWDGSYSNLLPGGYLGVDIFFVISGYLITNFILSDLERGKFKFVDFYERRARRLLPALFTVIFASIIAGYIFLLPNQLKDLSNSALSSLLFLSNFYFYFADNYFAEASSLKPLLHTWSLSVEEQFYFLFPPLLYFLFLRKKNILLILIILILFSLIFSQFSSIYLKKLNFYIIISRIWELGIGSLIAFFHLKEKKKFSTKNNYLVYFSFFLIILPFIYFDENTLHPSLFTIFTIIGVSLIIYYKDDKNLIKKFLSSKPLVGVGLISYSLYLWHYPILAFKKIKSNNLSEFDKLEAIILATILSIISFFIIEKPLRNKKILNRKGFFTIITTSFLFLLISSIYITYSKGLPKRFSTEVLSLIDFNYEYKRIYQAGSCHIENKKIFNNEFFSKCKVNKSNKKNLYLWGDSLGAHLYPGIKQKYENNYNIFQRTVDACKPINSLNLVGKSLDNCKLINRFILNEIIKEKPDKIFLSGFWEEKDLKELKSIVKILKKNNVSEIYLFGPSPRWHDPLPKILYKKYRLLRKIPEYLFDENHKKNYDLDEKFTNFSKKNRINYISPVKILCKKEDYTCLTKVGKEADSIVNWDENHFTEKGSIYIFSKFIDKKEY